MTIADAHFSVLGHETSFCFNFGERVGVESLPMTFQNMKNFVSNLFGRSLDFVDLSESEDYGNEGGDEDDDGDGDGDDNGDGADGGNNHGDDNQQGNHEIHDHEG